MSDLVLIDKIPEEYRAYIITPQHDAHLVERQYRLTIDNERETSRGVAWVGTIYSNKTIVCKVENGGSGGCNNYTPVDIGMWEIFRIDARVAFEGLEPEDSLCQYIDLMSL
jgi:hypothetical protein